MLANRMMMAAAGRVKVLTFEGSDGSDANAASYTFSSKTYGAGTLFVAAHTNITGTISTITVGGQSMTAIKQASGTSSGVASIFAILSPPDGSGGQDIVVTPSASAARCGIAWWTATNMSSITPVDTGSDNGAGANADTLTTIQGGFCLAAGYNNGNAVGCTITGVTEKYDAAAGSTESTKAGGSAATTGANITPSLTWGTEDAASQCMAAATF